MVDGDAGEHAAVGLEPVATTAHTVERPGIVPLLPLGRERRVPNDLEGL
ncbi:hypothetical protein ACFQFH_19385 [Halobaculum halobium]|uniref:Uncharacterized protein n=1 Tax=Halobaculum halobium TaxID=3032281 RepID=A0ABD5T703_9EURY